MTAYPQIACGAATFLHLRHGQRHAVPGLGGQGAASSTTGKGKADYCVQCGRVGPMILSSTI